MVLQLCEKLPLKGPFPTVDLRWTKLALTVVHGTGEKGTVYVTCRSVKNQGRGLLLDVDHVALGYDVVSGSFMHVVKHVWFDTVESGVAYLDDFGGFYIGKHEWNLTKYRGSLYNIGQANGDVQAKRALMALYNRDMQAGTHVELIAAL